MHQKHIGELVNNIDFPINLVFYQDFDEQENLRNFLHAGCGGTLL